MFKIINAEQAETLIASEKVRILDVRDFRSYRAGHIDGAVLLHEGLEQRLVDDGAFDEPVLLYCYRGIQSREKAEHFTNLGFERVYSLEGGYTDWPRAERDAAPPG